MAEYCKKCELLLITDRERAAGVCRFCMTDYERKYAELIKYNRFVEKRLWNYCGAAFTAAGAFGYWILS
jgi:hypothetical protein